MLAGFRIFLTTKYLGLGVPLVFISSIVVDLGIVLITCRILKFDGIFIKVSFKAELVGGEVCNSKILDLYLKNKTLKFYLTLTLVFVVGGDTTFLIFICDKEGGKSLVTSSISGSELV